MRDWALGGVFGNWVQVTDGRHKYARGPAGDNLPLSMWSNRWSTMPIHVAGITALPLPDERAVLDRMPGSTVPVIRQPYAAGDALPYWVSRSTSISTTSTTSTSTRTRRENRCGEPAEREMIDLLRTALVEVEAPARAAAATRHRLTGRARSIRSGRSGGVDHAWPNHCIQASTVFGLNT